MTRATAHQRSFEKALHIIRPTFHRKDFQAFRNLPTSTTTYRPGTVLRRSLDQRAGV